jgi:MFS family permease
MRSPAAGACAGIRWRRDSPATAAGPSPVIQPDFDADCSHSTDLSGHPVQRRRVVAMRALAAGGMFRALGARNYRLFFFGQMVSLIGTWMQSIAQSWLIYRLTGSAALLGLVVFCNQLPVFFLAPLGGWLADRLPKRALLVATQGAAMLLALTLSALVLGGWVRVPHIFVIATLLGVVRSLDVPTRQAFVVEMVGKADLMNAIALNSSVFNSARMIGPAIAGATVAAVGEGWCFFADGVSYLAVIAGLVAMRDLAPVASRVRARPWRELTDGMRFVIRERAVLTLLLLLGAMGLCGLPYASLMPLFADRVFGGGAGMLGWMMSAAGIGALGGALTLARRERLGGLGRWIAVAALVFGCALSAFALSHWLALSLALLAVIGYCMIVVMAGCNTLVQSLTPDLLRGRVMAVYSMVFMGSMPLGAAAFGLASEHLGAPVAVAIGGVLCVIAGGVFLRALPALRDSARALWARSQPPPSAAPAPPSIARDQGEAPITTGQ